MFVAQLETRIQWHRNLFAVAGGTLMTESTLQELVRNFPENGPKLLLEHPATVRELLTLLHEQKVHAIDFAAMSVERTHFVQPDYQHVAVDLLLKAPFRVGAGGSAKSILIYL